MSRMTVLDPAVATGKTKELLDAVKSKMGKVPNLVRTMAHSSAALEAYLNLSGALAGGVLTPKQREQIALAVAQANGCEYCLSAHTLLGKMAGLGEGEIAAARQGSAADPKSNAILQFARQVVDHRGAVSDAVVSQALQAGLTEGEIAEIVANVALNVYTNYLNNVARIEVDFPRVAL